jgi:CheY-like chemotaxis protein
VARLEHHFRLVDVRVLLQRARETVEPLALQRHVRLCAEVPEGPAILSTDPVIAEQVLVNVLSHAVQQADRGDLGLSLTDRDGQISLVLHYFPEANAARTSTADLVVTQLVDRLAWLMERADLPDGPRTTIVRMTRRSPTILVIDDNQGLVKLMERFLAQHTYRVVPAANGLEGLRLAQDLLPDAIVLDVMMPEMPGWEVLQRLRNHPRTADIPVIICSVFNNPELAYSLGASLFLPKPIGRDDVLKGLHQLNVV